MTYLIIVSFIWAFSFGLIKYNLTNIDPNLIAFLRMSLAFPMFLFLFKPLTINKRQFISFTIVGAIQYGLMYVACMKAYEYLEAHQVALFTTFTPIYIVLFDGLLKKQFNPIYYLVACLAIFSCYLLFSNLNNFLYTSNFLCGFILVQIADICFAFGLVLYRILRKRWNKLVDHNIFALMFFGGMISTAIACTISYGWQSLNLITWHQILVISYLGLISSGICFFMWNRGALLVNSGTLAVFNNLKLPLGIIVSIIFFKENANIFKVFLSFIIITFAILFVEYYEKISKK